VNSKVQNRRTSKEVREDVKKIMLQSDAATTFSELARFSGLSYSQLMTTLSQFPNLKRTISEKLKNNSIQKQYSLGYVIDASILNVSTQVLNQIIDDNNTIICLNTTIKELDEIHKTGKDENSKKAHFLMLKILYEQEHFAVIDYRKAHSIKPDDVIIAYCKENKHRAVLLTADKNMALKARASKILVQYYTPSEILPNGIKRLEKTMKSSF
jgi:rRNA-processing protein FCF1